MQGRRENKCINSLLFDIILIHNEKCLAYTQEIWMMRRINGGVKVDGDEICINFQEGEKGCMNRNREGLEYDVEK